MGIIADEHQKSIMFDPLDDVSDMGIDQCNHQTTDRIGDPAHRNNFLLFLFSAGSV